MNNRILTIAAACYHKYSQHFVDLERFYEIAKEDGRVAEREECAKVCEKNLRSWDKTSDRNDDYRSAHIKDMVEILARGDMK